MPAGTVQGRESCGESAVEPQTTVSPALCFLLCNMSHRTVLYCKMLFWCLGWVINTLGSDPSANRTVLCTVLYCTALCCTVINKKCCAEV